tara:strand:+ start:969 stop:1439 length:471 start_codon:yes stop_codon:yes gene_type:complete
LPSCQREGLHGAITLPLHAFSAQGFSGLYAVTTGVYLFLRVEDIAFAWCQLLPQVEYTERGYPFVSIQTWEGLLEKIRQCVAPAESDDDDALVSARTSNVPGRRAQPRASEATATHPCSPLHGYHPGRLPLSQALPEAIGSKLLAAIEKHYVSHRA